MANLIDELKSKAELFMDKQKSYENKKRNEMIDIIDELSNLIYVSIRRQDNISLSFINTFLETEIYPLIDEYSDEIESLLDESIRRNFDLGVTQAGRFLTLSKESFPTTGDISNEAEYREVLAALLLYSTTLSKNLMQDLKTKIKSDITSIYITNKRMDAKRDVKSDNDKSISTILKGSIISKYIYDSFSNIKRRADMMAMNETNRALNHALLMKYLKSDITHVKWVAVLDGRACKHCLQAANGGDGHGVYRIESIDPPPLHSRCRCILIPYSKRWDMED